MFEIFKKTPEAVKNQDFIDEFVSFSDTSNFNRVFKELKGVKYNSSAIVDAVVKQIIDLALEAKLEIKDMVKQKRFYNPNKDQNQRRLLKQWYYNYLTTGNGFLFRSGNEYLVSQAGNESIAYDEYNKVYMLKCLNINGSDTKTYNLYREDLAHLRWDANDSDDPLSKNPLQNILDLLKSYDALQSYILDFTSKGNKISYLLKKDNQVKVSNIENFKKAFKDVTTQISADKRFSAVALKEGLEIDKLDITAVPDVDKLYNVIVKVVCSVYGVPSYLVGVKETGNTNPDNEQIYDSLYRSAVRPLLKQAEAELEKHLSVNVKFKTDEIGKPDFTGMANASMKLSQSGIFTKNEIREMWGYKGIEGGNEIPAPAGAPNRDKTDKGE